MKLSQIINVMSNGIRWLSPLGMALPLGGKPPVPIDRRLGGSQEFVRTQRLEEAGSNTGCLVVQSVVRHYTD
jgi:hypothetical protein